MSNRHLPILLPQKNMELFGRLLLVPVAIGNSLLRGWVFVTLWNWFIVSQFSQVPHISVVGAIGIMITVATLKVPSLSDKDAKEYLQNKKEEIPLSTRWFQASVYFMTSLFALLGGWIWHHFL